MTWQPPKRLISGAAQRYFPRAWLSLRILRHDRHFEPEFWLIPMLCRRDQVAIDIGANMGEFAYHMARHAGEVIAFEPNVDIVPALQRLVGAAVRVEPVALSNFSGEAIFRYLPENTGVATIEQRNELGMIANSDTIRSRAVPLRTLDSFRVDQVCFMKIDVEGHEEAVIEGALETLRRSRPSLLIESEDRHNPGAPRRLAKRLGGLGFLGFFLRHDRLIAISEISESERDARNIGRPGAHYINNYLFIPSERDDLIDRLSRWSSGVR